jgi:hypothetical protein
MLKKLSQHRLTIQRAFATKAPSGDKKPVAKIAPETPKTPVSQPTSEKSLKSIDIGSFKYSTGIPNMFDIWKQGGKIDELTNVEYKSFPADIGHWNPESPEYIESPLDEERLRKSIKSHNDIIDGFKRDLEIQRQYQEAIQHMDRPYLHSTTPGIDSNVYATVKDYTIPFRGARKTPELINDQGLQNLSNEKWPVNMAAFHSKTKELSNILEWEEELRNRPVTDHYHHDKGSKFDVRVPLEERYPHVADRLGHPEIFPTPIETLLRLERALSHPGYLDQPFVKIPSAEPDADLDFTSGDIIYENPKAAEWGRFWSANYIFTLAYLACWNPYISFIVSTSPSFKVRDEVFSPFHEQNWYNWDYYQLFPVVFGAVAYLYMITGLVC